jgi:hypothetical protein
VQISEKDKSIVAGDSFELRCSASGNPEPTIVWLFNNNTVDGLNNVYPRGNILIVRDAQVDLNGYFTCRAVGQDGQYAEDSALVRVSYPQQPGGPSDGGGESSPSIQVTPSYANPAVGDTVRFSCLISDQLSAGQSDIAFIWTKQDGSLPNGADPNENGVLTLYNVQEQDSGVYVCEAYNARGQGPYPRATATLSVSSSSQPAGAGGQQGQDAPLKVEVEPKVGNLVQGRDGEFTCNVVGGRNPVVTWKKVSDSLDPSRHIVEGNKLTIRNAQPSDRGYFECQAQSGEDNAMRDYVRIEIEERTPPLIEIYPKESQVEIDFGSVFYAQCRVTSGTPPPTIEWRRADGKPLTSKVSVTQEGTLIQIQDAGQEESGAYECVASNPEGEARSQVNLVVRGGPLVDGGYPDNRPNTNNENEGNNQDNENQPYYPQYPQQPEGNENNNENVEEEPAPEVIIDEKEVVAEPGSSPRLQCRSNSRTPVRFEWSNQQYQPLPSEADGSLQLNNVKESDIGYYICTVSNRFGTSRGFVLLNVREREERPPGYGEGEQQQPQQPQQPQPGEGEERPGEAGEPQRPAHSQLIVQVYPKSRNVLVGDTVEFTCNVQSHDRDPLIRWSRAGGADMPAYHSVNGNVLRLQNLQIEDSGRYQCSAQSSDGNINFDAAHLKVSRRDLYEPFPVYLKVADMQPADTAQPTLTYRYGIKVVVECVPQTEGIQEITWSKAEGVGRGVYERRGSTNVMTIPALVPMDLGTYVCIATRADGQRAQNSIVFERHADHGNLFKYEVQGPTEPVEPESYAPQQPHDGNQYPHQQPDYHTGGDGQGHQHGQQEGGQSTEPVAKIQGEKQLRLSEGDSANIVCEVSGSPTPTIQWERHGRELPSGHRIYGNTLSLYNLKSSDSGYYICNAENSAGRTRDYAYVEVAARDENAQPQGHGGDNGQSHGNGHEANNQDRDRDRDQQDSRPTPSSETKDQKPFVFIKSLSEGKQIKPGAELKLVCLVSGNTRLIYLYAIVFL